MLSTATSMPAFIWAPTSALMPESVTNAPSLISCWAKAGAARQRTAADASAVLNVFEMMLMDGPPCEARVMQSAGHGKRMQPCALIVCRAGRGPATCRHARDKRFHKRSHRLRAVQERDFLDRRRDGAHRVPHDLFGRAQGQHGLLDRLRRCRWQAGGAGPDLARSSRLGA